jgi:hypothetical protein
MNHHSVLLKAIPKPENKSTKIRAGRVIFFVGGKRKGIRDRKSRLPKSKIKMAERTGLEPAYPFGRRFSRPLHYHYATSPQIKRKLRI